MPLSWEELEQIRGRRDWRIPVPPTCPNCEYNLTGLPNNRCPECGQIFNWTIVRRRAGRIWSAINTLRNADRDSKAGLKIVLAGYALLFPFLWGNFMTCFIRAVAGAAGLLAVVLGSEALHISRVPVWARCHIEGQPPSVALGLTTVLLGMILVAAALLVWL